MHGSCIKITESGSSVTQKTKVFPLNNLMSDFQGS